MDAIDFIMGDAIDLLFIVDAIDFMMMDAIDFYIPKYDKLIVPLYAKIQDSL